jgi:predicted small lipoprotein YifL
MTRRAVSALLPLLALAALLSAGCGRKAKPEPLFGGATTNHYETR